MKRKKLGMSLMLTAAVVSASIGGMLLKNGVMAEEGETTAQTYALSDVFLSVDATVGATEEKVTSFTLPDEGEVTLKRDLALKWFEKQDDTVEQKSLKVKFALKDTNFKTLDITIDSPSAWATKDEISTNVVTLEKQSDNSVCVFVNKQEGDVASLTIAATDVFQTLTLELTENATDGEYDAYLAVADATSQKIGTFINVGANYTEYEYDKSYPLTFSAAVEGEDEETTVLLYEINGQKFDGIEDNKVTDTAAPVLVVNESISAFTLGAAFSLDYQAIDVLNTKTLTKNLRFYQWTPVKTQAPSLVEYSTLSISTYFMDTVYYVNEQGEIVTSGGTAQSVYYNYDGDNDGNPDNKEYVSMKAFVGDGTFKDVEYDLAWYANADAKQTLADGVEYVIVDRNTEGASYNAAYVQKDDLNKINVLNEAAINGTENSAAGNAAKSFLEQLAQAATEVPAGSNAYVYVPSLKWLIHDNNGYRNLKFTLTYKAPSAADATSSSSLSYNELKIATNSAGMYEFKVFATDKAGNPMEYYDENGQLVSLTSSNVWDIDGIPSFTFEIADKPLEVEEADRATDRRTTQILNKTYTFNAFTLIGATSAGEDYALYKVDLSKCDKLTQSMLINVTYKQLADEIAGKLSQEEDYFETYLNAYATILANVSDSDVEDVLACFTAVKEYDARITQENAPTEWNEYNQYKWTPDSKSFTTAQEGTYLILADYYENEIWSQRATAYKIVLVESEADVIKGETNWLKNNVVSVVLFSIAGVMLILIIILLLVKPSSETLEDVDAKAATAAKKQTKKQTDKKEKKNK